MTGSLRSDKGKFYAVLNLKDEFGKRKQKTINLNIEDVPGNKRKAKSALREVLLTYEQNRMDVCKKDIFFCEYIKVWHEEAKPKLEQDSYESYKSMIDCHIYPYFKESKITLRNLTYQQIQKYYNTKGETLSANTLKKHHAVINQTLKKALRNDLIPHNPADRVTLPKIKKYTGKFLTIEEGLTLLDAVAGKPLEPIVILGMMYGLRRSEIAGLKWDAVDFENGTIAIRHIVTRLETYIAADRAKNKSSYRTLPLNDAMREFLLRLREQHEKDKAILGSAYFDTEYVCRWPDGKPLRCDYMSRAFRWQIDKLGLPPVRLHDLRHTCASILLKAGCNMKEISDWLGHVDIGTTMNIYAHLDSSAKKNVADTLGNMFSKKSVMQSVMQIQDFTKNDPGSKKARSPETIAV